MIFKDGRVLLGKRMDLHRVGEYAFPGGRLEYLESFEQCARRETREECGREIENIRFQFLSNVTRFTPSHTIHIGLIADCAGGDPEAREPEKFESWEWYEFDKLPERDDPLFGKCKQDFDCYESGEKYRDI